MLLLRDVLVVRSEIYEMKLRLAQERMKGDQDLHQTSEWAIALALVPNMLCPKVDPTQLVYEILLLIKTCSRQAS